MDAPIFTKRLCMSQFSIRLSTIPQPKFFDVQENGKLTAAFIYLAEGEGVLRTDTLNLRLTEGSLLYVPEKTRYTLRWLSADKTKYYTVFAVASNYDTAMMNDKFHLQIVKELSTRATGDLFHTLYGLMKSGERIEKIRAVSLYYGFYAEALRYLQSAPSVVYHPAVVKAVEWLGEHFAEDTPIPEIAKICCISEPRLYALFREQVGASPTAFRNEKRVQRAAELLKTELSVEEICERTGFNSLPYFYETFKKLTHLTPNEYRRVIR